MTQKTYVGIYNDEYGGMTPTGTVIKDAWVFGLLPENESCDGWTADRLQALYDSVSKAWEPYGQLVSNLPPELRERHARIFDEAIKRAKEMGWSPELDHEE